MKGGSMSEKPHKVFFDFDGTLTTKDSLVAVVMFVVGRPVFFLKSIFLLPILCFFILGVTKREDLKNIFLRVFLSKYQRNELTKKAEVFVEKILPNIMRKEGCEIYQKYLKLGCECILVSASLDLYLDIWAMQNGFQKVISTRFLGTPPKMMGGNCYGAEKVRRIMEEYPDIESYLTSAYGDTKGDTPMLKKMNHGFMWSKKTGVFLEITG